MHTHPHTDTPVVECFFRDLCNCLCCFAVFSFLFFSLRVLPVAEELSWGIMRELLFSVWTFLSYRGEGEGVEGTNMLFYLLFIDLLALSAAYVCVFFFFFLPWVGPTLSFHPHILKRRKQKKRAKEGLFFFREALGGRGYFFLVFLFLFLFLPFNCWGKKKKNAESKVKYTRNRKRIKTALFKRSVRKAVNPCLFYCFFFFFLQSCLSFCFLLWSLVFLSFFFFFLRRHISEKYMHNK